MKAALILKAIACLDKAGTALRRGATVEEQVRIGFACAEAEINLRLELEREYPYIKIEQSGAADNAKAGVDTGPEQPAAQPSESA